MILLFLFWLEVESSYSSGFNKNPELYYRDPCPEDRPTDLCNALDEYVWKKDDNFQYDLVDTNTEHNAVTGYTFKVFNIYLCTYKTWLRR